MSALHPLTHLLLGDHTLLTTRNRNRSARKTTNDVSVVTDFSSDEEVDTSKFTFGLHTIPISTDVLRERAEKRRAERNTVNRIYS